MTDWFRVDDVHDKILSKDYAVPAIHTDPLCGWPEQDEHETIQRGEPSAVDGPQWWDECGGNSLAGCPDASIGHRRSVRNCPDCNSPEEIS